MIRLRYGLLALLVVALAGAGWAATQPRREVDGGGAHATAGSGVRLGGTIGGLALPNGATRASSANYAIRPGFSAVITAPPPKNAANPAWLRDAR